jgi:thioredoxin 1
MCVSETLLQVCEYPCSGARSRPLVWLAIFGIAWFVVWIAKRKKGGKPMNATRKVVVIVVLIASVVAVMALKQSGKGKEGQVAAEAPTVPVTAVAQDDAQRRPTTEWKQALPRLVDLGSDTCIPCKMMVPVLDELQKEYAGRLSVEFYDVRKDPSVGARYGIRVIPTQIFYDAAGNERFRHEGFFSKEDILTKWKELGMDLRSE